MSTSNQGVLARALSPDLTRRSFLRGALGSAALAATMPLVACGGGSNGGGDEGAGEAVLRFGTSNPGANVDTQLTSNTIGISENVCDTLVTLNPDTQEVEPLLLTSLPTVSDDGLTYSFELKSGVKFHDGTELTANDVKYTFERLFKLKSQTDSYTYIVGAQDIIDDKATELTGLEVQDDTHFTITLTQVYSSFVRMLCQFYASIYPAAACEAAGDNWGIGTDFIGTGPFKIESNDDSTECTLVAFDDYHEGRPALDRIEITYIDDAGSRVMSYQNNDIDLCFVDTSLLEQYKDDPEISAALVYYTPAATQFLNLNLNGPEFQDIKVREALSLAINRQELCDTILSGAALPCTGFIPPSESGSDPNGTVLEYNVDRAKELLTEAGNPTVSFTAKVRPVDENVMVAIQGMWSEIGVDCKVETMDPQQWRDDRAAGNLVCTLVTWSTLSFVGVEHMGSYFTSDKASLRSSFYNSPEFDAYVQAARSALDEAEVTENTIKADNQLVRTDFGTIPVDWPQNPYVLREGFDGLEVLVDFHFKHVTKA